jgi:hypothetical protein
LPKDRELCALENQLAIKWRIKRQIFERTPRIYELPLELRRARAVNTELAGRNLDLSSAILVIQITKTDGLARYNLCRVSMHG